MGFSQSDYVLSFDGIDDAVIIELDSNEFIGYQGNSYKSLMIDMEFEVYGNSMADTFPVQGYLFTIPSLRLGVSYYGGTIYINELSFGGGLSSISGIQDSTFYRLTMTIFKDFDIFEVHILNIENEIMYGTVGVLPVESSTGGIDTIIFGNRLENFTSGGLGLRNFYGILDNFTMYSDTSYSILYPYDCEMDTSLYFTNYNFRFNEGNGNSTYSSTNNYSNGSLFNNTSWSLKSWNDYKCCSSRKIESVIGHSPTIQNNSSISLTVSVTDSTNNQYQWYEVDTLGIITLLQNGGRYSGVNTENLSVNILTFDDNGLAYRCEVLFINGNDTCRDSRDLQVSVCGVLSNPDSSVVGEEGKSAKITCKSDYPESTYQWQKMSSNGVFENLVNTGQFSGANDSVLVIDNLSKTANHNTRFRCWVRQNCSLDTSSSTILNVFPLGVNDDFVKSLSFFPNPTKGMIQLKSSEVPYHFEIKDITGKLIKSHLISETNHSIDLSSIENGVYIYTIVKDNTRYSDKLILSK